MIPSTSIFIGSSVEGKAYADAVFTELEVQGLQPTAWDLDIFEPGKSAWEDLNRISRRFDFAVLILTPDDVVRSRGRQAKAARDNVLLELGLFTGQLGSDRVLFLAPAAGGLRLPTDLLGITYLTYAARSDGNLRAAVRTAAGRIAQRVRELGPRDGDNRPVLATLEQVDGHIGTVSERFDRAARSPGRVLVSGIDCAFIGGSRSADVEAAVERGVNVDMIVLDPAADCATRWLPELDPRFNTEAEFKEAVRGVAAKMQGINAHRYAGRVEVRYLPFLPAVNFFVVDPDDLTGPFKVESYAPARDRRDSERHDLLRQHGRPHWIIPEGLVAWRRYFLAVWAHYWAIAGAGSGSSRFQS